MCARRQINLCLGRKKIIPLTLWPQRKRYDVKLDQLKQTWVEQAKEDEEKASWRGKEEEPPTPHIGFLRATDLMLATFRF